MKLTMMDANVNHSDSNSNSSSSKKFLLPESFEPNEYSVICGRGKVYSASPGNNRLQKIVSLYVTSYSQATTKPKKSEIVSMILRRARQGVVMISEQTSLFVKFENDRWYSVSDNVAREKVGGMLRERLSSQYKSSSKAKIAKRQSIKAIENALRKGDGVNSNGGGCTTTRGIINTVTSNTLRDIPQDITIPQRLPHHKIDVSLAMTAGKMNELSYSHQDNATSSFVLHNNTSYNEADRPWSSSFVLDSCRTTSSTPSSFHSIAAAPTTSAHSLFARTSSSSSNNNKELSFEQLERACDMISEALLLEKTKRSSSLYSFLDDNVTGMGPPVSSTLVDVGPTNLPSNFDPTSVFD